MCCLGCDSADKLKTPVIWSSEGGLAWLEAATDAVRVSCGGSVCGEVANDEGVAKSKRSGLLETDAEADDDDDEAESQVVVVGAVPSMVSAGEVRSSSS